MVSTGRNLTGDILVHRFWLGEMVPATGVNNAIRTSTIEGYEEEIQGTSSCSHSDVCISCFFCSACSFGQLLKIFFLPTDTCSTLLIFLNCPLFTFYTTMKKHELLNLSLITSL